MSTPGELPRQDVDNQLEACIWMSESRPEDNLCASRGVTVDEFAVDTDQAHY